MHINSKVFFIEDDAAVCDAMSISLGMAGFKTEIYPSGKAFLDTYTTNRPGCLLMNLRLSDMGGLSVYRELKRRNFHIPVILMTEIATIPNLLPVLQAGFFCILENPFSRTLLIERVSEAMQQDCHNRPGQLQCPETLAERLDSKEYERRQQKRVELLKRHRIS